MLVHVELSLDDCHWYVMGALDVAATVSAFAVAPMAYCALAGFAVNDGVVTSDATTDAELDVVDPVCPLCVTVTTHL